MGSVAAAHQPLAYLTAVANHLRVTELDLWRWFASDAFAERYKSATDTDLLRTAIRLDRSGPNARRYQLAERARDTLGLAEPIVLYQMQDSSGTPNAFSIHTPGEITVAFSGRILELLNTDAELLDLLGHEISHHKLFAIEGGRFHVADRLLAWVGQRESCPPEFIETWRRNRLCMEIYCDIGGLVACGDRDATIRGLVKTIADFRDVDASSYLKQAHELMAKGPGVTRGTTHPELFVRVLAIANAGALTSDAHEALIAPLIAGPIELGGLDLLDQRHVHVSTRQLLRRALGEDVLRSEVSLAQARHLFHDFVLAETTTAPVPFDARGFAQSTQDYLSYMLLDVAAADAEALVETMAPAVAIADEAGFGQRFREIVRAEFKGRRTVLAKLTGRAA